MCLMLWYLYKSARKILSVNSLFEGFIYDVRNLVNKLCIAHGIYKILS